MENYKLIILSTLVALSITQTKQIVNSLLLNSFYPVNIIPTSSKRKRRTIVHGLVTRYGPQSVASASG